MPRYNPATIEPKWQQYWESHHTFRTPEHSTSDSIYVLDMFPYPSGDGLHVGHPEGYTATDIVCRFARMNGKTVLHPMGFDAFGLPAEEHAIRTNTSPRVSTERNIQNFTRQLKMLGFSYDWDRALATTDVEYVRWTQWIFLVLFDTWFDVEQQLGRPISELPIPDDVASQGSQAVRLFQDAHRLAYQADALVNWCQALGTVLANEEVIDGKSERGSHEVTRMPLRQWMLRITAYADRLEQDLESLDWSDGVKKLQRDWIGQSTGAEVDFFIADEADADAWGRQRADGGFPTEPADDVLRIYTTRPDTLYGATYMVLSPEHAFVAKLTTDDQQELVEAYCRQASFKSDRERMEGSREKTGVFSGSYAINPVNQKPIPIWIADYVLISYGTGAIMAVPAHDIRDFEFAQQFGLEIIAVVDPPENADVDRDAVQSGAVCYVGAGFGIQSAEYDGLATADFITQITDRLNQAGIAKQAVHYKLRDWLFSRQRFWGEPFPILHELDDDGKPNGLMKAVDVGDLPVNLPEMEDYKPHGRPEPPLEKADDSWLFVTRDGKKYRRETNTMPQWAGSCWYYLRFIDPHNNDQFVDPEKERQWMPVDLYVGGAEHAVLHLLYSRFWHKVLFDRGHVSTAEPFQKLVNQGMILGEMEFTGYRDDAGQSVSSKQVAKDAQGIWRETSDQKVVEQVQVDADDVVKHGDGFVLKTDANVKVESRAFKMSKSRGNVVNPDTVVQNYGADALRLFEMFMGPLEATKPWSMAGVHGVRNFLDRVWRLIVDEPAEEIQLHQAVQDVEPADEQLRVLHKTLEAVTRDTEAMHFNTAIARMMEYVNYFTRQTVRPRGVLEPFVLMLAPYAPHLAEELWQLLGHQESLSHHPWPKLDPKWSQDDTIEIPVQILGKLRARVTVPVGTDKEGLESAARAEPRIEQILSEKQVIKVIAVPDRLVNFVVK